MKKPPAEAHRGHKDKILVLCFLDLLGRGSPLFLLSPPTTMMVLMPMAGFLLHQPALGDPARLPLEVAFFLARVAHDLSLLSAPLATLPVPLQKSVPGPPDGLNGATRTLLTPLL